MVASTIRYKSAAMAIFNLDLVHSAARNKEDPESEPCIHTQCDAQVWGVAFSAPHTY